MKLYEMAEMQPDQLAIKLTELRHDLAEIRFGRAAQPLDNPLRIRILRRDIARAETLLKEYAAGTRTPKAAR